MRSGSHWEQNWTERREIGFLFHLAIMTGSRIHHVFPSTSQFPYCFDSQEEREKQLSCCSPLEIQPAVGSLPLSLNLHCLGYADNMYSETNNLPSPVVNNVLMWKLFVFLTKLYSFIHTVQQNPSTNMWAPQIPASHRPPLTLASWPCLQEPRLQYCFVSCYIVLRLSLICTGCLWTHNVG